MKQFFKDYGSVFVVYGGMILLFTGVWVVKSHFEAKTYSEITGKHITTGQALWVQFRITEPYPDKD